MNESQDGTQVGEDYQQGVVERYPPPYRLLSDMLFAVALCPAAPLQATFPTVPFRVVGGRAVLATWFSSVRRIRYGEADGTTGQLGGQDEILYHELNVVALLKTRALFSPAIYATSALTIAIGHHYGMPKQPTTLQIERPDRRFIVRMEEGGQQSTLAARRIGPGRPLGRGINALLPRWSWPTYFPDGRSVKAHLLDMPVAQLAWIGRSRLALPATWLPKPLSFLPIGLYAPGLEMKLPPPTDE